jgi:hypothetical protein
VYVRACVVCPLPYLADLEPSGPLSLRRRTSLLALLRTHNYIPFVCLPTYRTQLCSHQKLLWSRLEALAVETPQRESTTHFESSENPGQQSDHNEITEPTYQGSAHAQFTAENIQEHPQEYPQEYSQAERPVWKKAPAASRNPPASPLSVSAAHRSSTSTPASTWNDTATGAGEGEGADIGDTGDTCDTCDTGAGASELAVTRMGSTALLGVVRASPRLSDSDGGSVFDFELDSGDSDVPQFTTQGMLAMECVCVCVWERERVCVCGVCSVFPSRVALRSE